MKKKSFLRWFKKRLQRHIRSEREIFNILTANPTVKFQEDVKVVYPGGLHLGEQIFVAKGTVLDCGGEWCANQGRISIGNNVQIGPYCIFYGAGGIAIERRVQFGPGVMIMTARADTQIMEDESLLDLPTYPHKFGKVTIGEASLIGSGAIILEGVSIGRGSYISAGSIIQRDIPPDSVVLQGKAKTISKDSQLFRPQ